MKVVGIEPSCTAALRSDLTELIDSPEALLVAKSVVTLAELLTADSDYLLPDLTGVEVLAQPHCHHHAVMGWDTIARYSNEAALKYEPWAAAAAWRATSGLSVGTTASPLRWPRHNYCRPCATRTQTRSFGRRVLLPDTVGSRLDDSGTASGGSLATGRTRRSI